MTEADKGSAALLALCLGVVQRCSITLSAHLVVTSYRTFRSHCCTSLSICSLSTSAAPVTGTLPHRDTEYLQLSQRPQLLLVLSSIIEQLAWIRWSVQQVPTSLSKASKFNSKHYAGGRLRRIQQLRLAGRRAAVRLRCKSGVIEMQGHGLSFASVR